MQIGNVFRDIYDKKDEKVIKIPTDKIRPSRYQPRIHFDENALFELSQSIKENGLIQPITVRKVDDYYEIIAGERRYRACLLAGFSEVNCYVMSPSEEQAAQMALVENVQRENLSAIEEAKSYVQIMRQASLTQEEVAQKIGKSQSAVANKIRLLNLPEDIQQGVIEGKITERHARALLTVPVEKVKEVYDHIVEAGLNVQDSERYINNLLNKQPRKRKQQTKGFTRNVQIAMNSVNECVEMIKKLGIDVSLDTEDIEDEVKMTVHLPKK